ncbi:MAG: cupin domain-containing protein [Mailhella sp.]|nr:cupin domain-containing protein [Mailhella sp.]
MAAKPQCGRTAAQGAKIAGRITFEKADPFGIGAPNDAYAQYFIGQSYLKPLTEYGKGAVFLANVTFEPGCRNNWHIHHASSGGGQILVCTAGEGWYGEEGKPVRSLAPGTVVVIPANVKHWHGAKADSWFSHIAVEVPGTDASTEWCGPVTDEEYAALAEN